MDNYITGNVIKRLREKKGMTQANFAEKLGVSDKAVSKWETGRGYPDITLLEPIASALGISVTELLSGEAIINGNVCGNMLRSKIYVCPVCGNVIHATGAATISCCGIILPPLEAETADEAHGFHLEQVEDETFVTIDHEMAKNHYISFIAHVNGDHFDLIKLYPEGNAETRFKLRGGGVLYAYCNKHGLYSYKIEAKRRWGKTAAYKEFEIKTKGKSDSEMDALGADFMKLFAHLGTLKHLDCADPQVQKAIGDIQHYITDHYYTCTPEILVSLGEMYIGDERFKKNIDAAGGDGTAAFAADAIRRYTEG